MLIKSAITADTNPELHLMLVRLIMVAELIIAPSVPTQTQEQESDPFELHDQLVLPQKLDPSQVDV